MFAYDRVGRSDRLIGQILSAGNVWRQESQRAEFTRWPSHPLVGENAYAEDSGKMLISNQMFAIVNSAISLALHRPFNGTPAGGVEPAEVRSLASWPPFVMLENFRHCGNRSFFCGHFAKHA